MNCSPSHILTGMMFPSSAKNFRKVSFSDEVVDAVVKATVSGGMYVDRLDRDVKIWSMAIQASINANVVRYHSLLAVIFSFAHSSNSSKSVTVC